MKGIEVIINTTWNRLLNSKKKWHNNILPFPYQQKREEEEINTSVRKKKKKKGEWNKGQDVNKCIVENLMKAGFYSQHELMPKTSHIEHDHST